MSSDRPPPYFPLFPEGAPTFPSALSSQPTAYPGSPYQTFPPAGGAGHSYYQTHPPAAGLMSPHGPLLTQPGYQGGHDGPHSAPYPPKPAVYVVERHQNQEGGGRSWLAPCSAALCCCCLWDALTSQHCWPVNCCWENNY
ncbi:cysteine-rich and transmembrane domain-containing protein 1-like [Parambassis ranga]|uniref:Cysteine-rich and transmembrane domain-containing protein 1 n=1 Tax=Parambassis ranga TaxID=210632 RepID=A0A6P7JMB9_9TELE|nr:cysteine-rich and transmembrane domain-containing protein 1 [Parambassis ranga]